MTKATWSQTSIICPECMQRHRPEGEDYAEGEHEYTCGVCHSSFHVSTRVQHSWETEPSR